MPDVPPSAADARVRSWNARIGLLLFFIYLLTYAGYVWLSAFRPDLMRQPVLGLQLSVGYGFLLIIAAFVLAVVYLLLCRTEAPRGHA